MHVPLHQLTLTARLSRALSPLLLVAVLGCTALLVALWLEHRSTLTLPAPTGPFAVGRAIYDWRDDSTLDTLALDPNTKRELLVWLWYPAAPGQSSTTVGDYLPAQMQAPIRRSIPAIFRLLTRDYSQVRTHNNPNADISLQQPFYPVVLMRAGASAEVWNYSTLAEDLASHGYVVVGFDAPYRTQVVVFPDGRVIHRLPQNNPELCLEMSGPDQERCAQTLLTAWTADMAFVLNRLTQLNASDSSGQFTGRLDLSRIGAFGHSFGGAAVLQFGHDDPRCKAAIDLDGAPHGEVIRSGIDRPVMLLLGAHTHESDPDSQQIKANLQSIYDHLPSSTRSFLQIRGANHFLFSDDGALLKSHALMRTLRLFGVVGLDGRRQLAITSHCLHTFFDAYLKDSNESRLDLRSTAYPEVQVVE
jgi:dienelactone hydrolase